MKSIILGRNAVHEAIKSGRYIDKLFISKTSKGVGSLVSDAKAVGAVIKFVDAEKLNIYGENHQGVVALSSPVPYLDVEDILSLTKEKGEAPFIIICDGIEDPHNLGALIRTAEAVGAHGLVIPKRRSVSVTPIVEKTSAGAVSLMPIARVSNLASSIDKLKKEGIWVYCADMNGETWCDVNLSGAIALVIGSEGRGVGHLIKQKCDGIISLPMNGKINSLNASVAGGILMYEILRQRNYVKIKN